MEEVRAKNITHGVEGRGVERRVHVISTGNTVRSQEGNDFTRTEVTSILEAREDLGDIVLGLGDETVDGRSSRVGTSSEELQLRGTLYAQLVSTSVQ